jgi:hypothetical protein
VRGSIARFAVLALSAALASLASASAAGAAPAEGQIRHRLAAATHRTLTAKSYSAEAVVALGKTGGRLVPFIQFETRMEKGTTLKTDTRVFSPKGSRDKPIDEVVTIGNRAWAQAKAEGFHEAILDPGVHKDFDSELANLERALVVGTGLKQIGPRRFELTAPSSVFNGPESSHDPISVLVGLTSDGHLRKLTRLEVSGGFGAVVTSTFGDFGHSFGIAPPPAEAILPGPPEEIHTQDEFAELLGFDESED